MSFVLKVIEDLSYVVLLRKKFSYIESIPGVLLPHPSSSPIFPFKVVDNYGTTPDAWHFQSSVELLPQTSHHHHTDFYDHQYTNHNNQPLKNIITPSMSSLEALLSKLPPVVPPPPMEAATAGQAGSVSQFQRPPSLEFDIGMQKIIAKDEIDEDEDNYRSERDAGESTSSMPAFRASSFQPPPRSSQFSQQWTQ